MSVDISYLGVVLAAVATMIVGAIWYAQGVFGATWGKLAKIKMDGKPTFTNMAPLLGMTFLASLVSAFMLAYFVSIDHSFYQNSWLEAGWTTALCIWLGFTALRFFVHDLFERRPRALTSLNVANELVTLLAMGLVLGIVHP